MSMQSPFADPKAQTDAHAHVKHQQKLEQEPVAIDLETQDDDDDDDVDQQQYKVIVLGDGSVGKTSICMRFCDDRFTAQYKQTIGVDFMSKKVSLPGSDINATVQLWDIGGQTIGSKMIQNYIYGANAVLLAYDITNYQSFQNLTDWMTLVKRAFDGSPLPLIVLVGSKADMQHLRAVRMDKHVEFMQQHKTGSCFVSAKTGDQVHSCFTRVVADLAGVALTKNQLESDTHVVKAELINHPQHDPETAVSGIKTQKSKCLIQ